MKLILLRHGHDLSNGNGESVLSNQGRNKVAGTASRIRAAGVQAADAAFCSGSARAKESLEIFGRHARVGSAYSSPMLEPGQEDKGLDAIVWKGMEEGAEIVLIVGHEPQMSNAVLRWCGVEAPEESVGRWVLDRGEAMMVIPRDRGGELAVDFDETIFFGQQRVLPRRRKHLGTFG